MRRTKRKWAAFRWTAAVATGALLVAGCGQLQLGAAALYANQRITTARLTSEVSNLDAAYRAVKSRVQIGYTPAEMPRQVLGWLLRFATVERLAAREGVRVTPAQAQAQLANEAVSARSAGDTLTEVAVLSGLPPDQLPELGRWLAIQNMLVRRLAGGVPLTTQAQQQAVTLRLGHLECLAAKSLNIKVNPQYGAFDYGVTGLSGNAGVVATANDLAAGPGISQPSPSARTQLTPKC